MMQSNTRIYFGYRTPAAAAPSAEAGTPHQGSSELGEAGPVVLALPAIHTRQNSPGECPTACTRRLASETAVVIRLILHVSKQPRIRQWPWVCGLGPQACKWENHIFSTTSPEPREALHARHGAQPE
jgi:hypothetical protein